MGVLSRYDKPLVHSTLVKDGESRPEVPSEAVSHPALVTRASSTTVS